MEITPVMEKFILFWGEMGNRWGVNRSVAQIHALLYLANKPLTADEIQETLQIARSNISNSLKELQSWKLVSLCHVMGDRRDHFEAESDPWYMVMVIIEGRKEREIDPALVMLHECTSLLNEDEATPTHVKQKIQSMTVFLEDAMTWYEQMRTMPHSTLKRLIKLGSKIVKLLGSSSA